ncbi:hypothetical protein [Acidimangrovimonas pyrenivorans]|uniref:HTH merR-type domain-containing protein n=1 Tax=Acidimangrovimonas pyrenivorans TaxID=2030798 RepID=A0ABV7AJA0_9RHOB
MSDLFTLSRADVAATLDVGYSSVGAWLAPLPLPTMTGADGQRRYRLVDLIPALRQNRKRGLVGEDLSRLIAADLAERERRGALGAGFDLDLATAENFLGCLTPEEGERAQRLYGRVTAALVMALWDVAEPTLAVRALALPAHVRAIFGDPAEMPPEGREVFFVTAFAARNAPHLFNKEAA